MAKKKKKPVKRRKLTLQEKLDQLKSSGALDSGGAGDAFWSAKPGTHYLRILPAVGEMDYFFEIVGRHWIDRSPHICPNVTQEMGDACPLCEAADAFFRGSKADKEMGKKLNPRKQFWMNVLIRDKGAGGSFKGPLIFTPGVQIFDALVGLLADEDYADEILSVERGIDVRLVREGTGRTDTSYDVFPTRKLVWMHPDHEDEDDAWDWLEENASDISSDLEIPDYDDLEEVLSELMEGPMEDEDEVAYARKKTKKRKRKRRPY